VSCGKVCDTAPIERQDCAFAHTDEQRTTRESAVGCARVSADFGARQ